MDFKKFVDAIFNVMLIIALFAVIGLLLTAKANAPIVVVEALPQPSAVTPPVEEACKQPLVIECVVDNIEEAYEPTLPDSLPQKVMKPPFAKAETVWVPLNLTDTGEEPKLTYSQEELDMLALVIYQEAGADTCTDKVRQMVGEVVLNRVADDRYPDTMEGVLTQVMPSGYGAYGRLHWTGIVWPERASYASETHAVDRAYDIAEKLLSGSVERLLPEDTVFQAEFAQGTEVVEQDGGFYFCR